MKGVCILLPVPELKTLSHSMTQSDKSLQWTPCRKHQVPVENNNPLCLIGDNFLQNTWHQILFQISW